MAAKPIERFVKRQIAEQGGWDRILERIRSGENDTKISETLLRPEPGQHISRSFFNTLLHKFVPREAITEARREYAHARVDHAMAVAESCPHDRDAVQKAKLVIDTDLRVAGFFDRDQFGDRPQVVVNNQLSISELHLAAFRHREVDADAVAVQSGRGKQFPVHVRQSDTGANDSGDSVVTPPLGKEDGAGKSTATQQASSS